MYSKKGYLDKFYTKRTVAKTCLNELNLLEYDCVIEPSAGDGSFFNLIEHENKIGLDLMPGTSVIAQQNWFDYKIDTKFKRVLIVGNPPFGKRNKLSIQFITHACSFENVKTLAFILPNVFMKHTLQKYIPARFRLKAILPLQENSFEIDGVDCHVPCSFFYFRRVGWIESPVQPQSLCGYAWFHLWHERWLSFFCYGRGTSNGERYAGNKQSRLFYQSKRRNWC